ncbi:hypothetical protein JMJ35_008025 [Cladonia borealis]|uniref:Transmembrane protein 32 protein n=1 Tax=Cladonia borealis TaxID=184061 RepID=A0AA39QXH0_9LECA|nr:hypothetical protein JMJ35_008025 [Cladonia borealis]
MPSYLSRPLTVLGLLFLSHACYSAYEHSTSIPHQPSNLASTPISSSPTSTSLPLDISLETVMSVIMICVGLVVGAEELKPITWRVWAGKVERESGGGGPFQGLEDRLGFVDIRAKRKEFADWVRDQDGENQR